MKLSFLIVQLNFTSKHKFCPMSNAQKMSNFCVLFTVSDTLWVCIHFEYLFIIVYSFFIIISDANTPIKDWPPGLQ